MNEIYVPLVLSLVVIWPLLLAVAIAFSVTHSAASLLAPWAALPAFILAVFAPPSASLHLPGFLLGTELSLVDDTGRLFLLFTALLWWLSGMYARAYLSDQPGRSRFFVYFLLSMTGNLGLILAQDLTSFYLFFALMSFASYGLVVHERSLEALRAGRIYIILVVIGEIALFAAMVFATAATGSTGFDTVRHGLAQAGSRDLIMLLAFIGFGIKAGVLGLHVWLPLAHPVAPTPASAVLSGAMIKAGLLGWLRLLPLGEMALLQWGESFMLLGLAAAFYGVMVGLTQRDPKTLLAYSSISQMGVMTVAVGLGLTSPDAYPAILTVITLYALHHGLSKGALFLGVGVVGAFSGVATAQGVACLVAAGPGACGCSVDKWHGGENHAESADGQRTRPLGFGVANTSALERRSHGFIGRAVSFSAVPTQSRGLRSPFAYRACVAMGTAGHGVGSASLVVRAKVSGIVVPSRGLGQHLAGAAWRFADIGHNCFTKITSALAISGHADG